MVQRERRHQRIEEEIADLPGENEQSRRRAGGQQPNPSEIAIGEIGWQAPHIPRDVETSRAKLVYVYLWMMRRAEITALSRATRVPQIRLIPVLETLVDRGYVESDGSTVSLSTME